MGAPGDVEVVPGRRGGSGTSRARGWDADGVLVRRAGPGLTEGLSAPARAGERAATGKTLAAPNGKQGMTTRQPRTTTSRPAPCRSAGPPLDVVEWRLCRLREAGFPSALAASLARMPVDLHALLELVDAGCPPELAARILSPLNDHAPVEPPSPQHVPPQHLAP